MLIGTDEHPVVDDQQRIHISYSSLKAFMQCQTKGVLYGLGYTSKEDSAAAKAGKCAHKAREVWLKSGGNNEDAMATFAAEYEDWANENVPLDNKYMQRLSYDNCQKILSTYFERHTIKSNIVYNENGNALYKILPDLIEVKFNEVELAEDVLLRGVIDNFVEDVNTGFYCVDDFKTTGQLNATWANTFKMDTQMTGYIYAGQCHTEVPITGALISGLEFSKLPLDQPTYKCATHKVKREECWPMHVKYLTMSISRTPKQIEDWKRLAVKKAREYKQMLLSVGTIDRIEKCAMEGTFIGGCNFCTYNEFCSWERNPKHIEQYLMPKEQIGF